MSRAGWRLALLVLGAVACQDTTSRFTPELQRRFATEDIVREAADQLFRYTWYSRGSGTTRWEERDASIIVTRQTVFIHKNEKVGLEIRRGGRGKHDVRRDGTRVIVGSGSGKSRVSWSFAPPDDADGWVRDIRAIIQGDSTGAE